MTIDILKLTLGIVTRISDKHLFQKSIAHGKGGCYMIKQITWRVLIIFPAKLLCMQTTHSDTALYALTQEIKFTQHILFIFASDFVRSYAYLYQEDKPCPRGVYTGISPASSDHISACRYSSKLLFSFWNFEFVLKTSGYPTGLETFRCRILL